MAESTFLHLVLLVLIFFFIVDRHKFISLLELNPCHQASIILCGDYFPVELNPRNNSAFLVRALGEEF